MQAVSTKRGCSCSESSSSGDEGTAVKNKQLLEIVKGGNRPCSAKKRMNKLSVKRVRK